MRSVQDRRPRDGSLHPIPAALLVLFLLSGTAPGAQNDLRDPGFMEAVRPAFDLIYNLDYQPAREKFEAIARTYPDHPAPPLYIAISIWLEELFLRRELDIENFVAPSYFDQPTQRRMPEPARQRFFELVEQSQAKSTRILQKDPVNADARYFLGSASGILGSFAITIDRSKKAAFDHGKAAYKIHEELVAEDPNYYDAYMSVGTYEYIVGNLPWYIKWLASIIGYRGSKERGFEYLSLAAEKGRFVADDARILRMVLLVREERYEEALQIVRYLEKKAPRNFILKLNEAQILEKLGRVKEAGRSYAQVISWAEAGRPNFHRLPLQTMRYTIGKKMLALGQFQAALTLFEAARTAESTPASQQTLATLAAGQTLDLMGRRTEAEERYDAVLKLQDFGAAHRQARKYLKTPYQQ